jgi:hypothetical protein
LALTSTSISSPQCLGMDSTCFANQEFTNKASHSQSQNVLGDSILNEIHYVEGKVLRLRLHRWEEE